MGKRHHFFNFAQCMAKGQHGTWIEENRLIALLKQINMALKDIIFLVVSHPPDAIRDLNGVIDIRLLNSVAWI
jgi:hypothetical protein